MHIIYCSNFIFFRFHSTRIVSWVFVCAWYDICPSRLLRLHGIRLKKKMLQKRIIEWNIFYFLYSVHHKTFLYELFLVALHFAVGNCLRELKKIYTQWDFWSTRSNVHFVSISIWRAFFCGVGTWRDDRQRIWRLDYVVIFEMHCFHTAWVPSLTNIWIYTFIRIKKLRSCQHKERILI